jgi:hypothetical protein
MQFRRFMLPLLLLPALAATTVEPLPSKPLPSILAEPPDASTEPATAPAVPSIWLQRRLISLSDALNKAPDSLRPRPAGWSPASQNQFTAWAIEELLGNLFEQQLHCIAATAQPTLDHKWELRPTFENHTFLAFGTMQTWTLNFPPLIIDDDTLAQWRTFQRGITMKVKGRVQSVNITRHDSDASGLPHFQFDITLARPEIIPPPSALHLRKKP